MVLSSGCERSAPPAPEAAAPVNPVPVFWKNVTVYFLLTDRFQNGDSTNDLTLGRQRDGALLRSFLGGDIRGVTRKIEEGYFDSLGVNALWMTPVVEQIHGKVDEGAGATYGFHGYWARDWTRLDPNFGTEEDLRQLVEAAHRRGIRVLMDVVINHTGPVTPIDSQWPDEWVRTGPQCRYTDYESTVECTLVANLPDVRTDKETEVALPPFLLEKWETEGRREKELAELDAFFARTSYPRAPKYYLIKWLTDWVRRLGIDGYRVDTAKHVEEEVWSELKKEAVAALREWKQSHPEQKLDDADFFMLGEVYGYSLGEGRNYNFGDRQVDYFAHGFESLINFGFKSDAGQPIDTLFRRYSDALNRGALQGLTVLNYVSSHDDGAPYDVHREHPLEAGTRLLLSPGGAQIYYGDETARPLQVSGVDGDANLRSFMNWDDLLQSDGPARETLIHWRKLGRFRQAHPAVGAGVHRQLQAEPYVFQRMLDEDGVQDRVVVALGAAPGEKSIPVGEAFAPGDSLKDYYSGKTVVVGNDRIARLDTPFDIVLLGAAQ